MFLNLVFFIESFNFYILWFCDLIVTTPNCFVSYGTSIWMLLLGPRIQNLKYFYFKQKIDDRSICIYYISTKINNVGTGERICVREQQYRIIGFVARLGF